jgi:hypothetical protein
MKRSTSVGSAAPRRSGAIGGASNETALRNLSIRELDVRQEVPQCMNCERKAVTGGRCLHCYVEDLF